MIEEYLNSVVSQMEASFPDWEIRIIDEKYQHATAPVKPIRALIYIDDIRTDPNVDPMTGLSEPSVVDDIGSDNDSELVGRAMTIAEVDAPTTGNNPYVSAMSSAGRILAWSRHRSFAGSYAPSDPVGLASVIRPGPTGFANSSLSTVMVRWNTDIYVDTPFDVTVEEREIQEAFRDYTIGDSSDVDSR